LSSFRSPSLAAIGAIASRDYRITRSYRLAFGLDAVYGGLELVIYFFLSKVVGPVDPAELAGAPNYFAYAAVGLVIGAVLSASTASVAQAARQEQLTGTLEVIAAQPVTSLDLSAGMVSFPLAFACVRAAVYLTIAGLFMHLDVSKTSWFGVVATLAATVVGMAPIGVVAAGSVLVFKRATLVVAGVISILTLFSGALFPIALLPQWMQRIAQIVPIRFAYDGVRRAMFEGAGWHADALALLAFGVIAAPLSLLVFSAAFDHAKKKGTVAEY
jgi:ABC-type multidrug transport system permease subunit